MKPIIFYFVCLLTFASCTHTNIATKSNSDFSTIRLHEGNWYFNFKNEVFIRCLKQAYPQRFSAFIDSVDASSAANVDRLDFNSEVVKAADNLATAFMKRVETSWTIEGKKITLNSCIAYRNSAELDAVAVTLYRRFHSKTK
jgi:hypothetical protein